MGTSAHILRVSIEAQEKALLQTQLKIDELERNLIQYRAIKERRIEVLEETKNKLNYVLETS